jgi:hypothetical protein
MSPVGRRPVARSAVAVAELEHHLRDAGQREAAREFGASRRGFQRLGVQAGEDPLGGGAAGPRARRT